MEGVIIVAMALSLPLSAIIGSYYVKLKKMKMQGSLSSKDIQRIEEVLKENTELKERVNNLEVIVTELDSQVRALPEAGKNY